ncbi:MAG: bifunctional salicylyl-CoA 5-hydroxylase/oxidoreductase [Myxococcales bacterium]|nr:bifunctional salicylyl-CoA 5-hydroxylase/oxidoreductase [Myxococcales bacterium]
MRVEVIGGGPGGLWLSILLKKRAPSTQVVIHERNRRGDTFGWGVVFSDQTLDELGGGDEVALDRIRAAFVSWRDMETHVRGQRRISSGHGFCGLRRTALLEILEDRALELGVVVSHQDEVVDFEVLAARADVVVAADGINSGVRAAWAQHFRPSLDQRKCRFAWFGTTKVFERFTFLFAETDAGLFQVHAYPFDATMSTFIIECRDEVYQRAGLDALSEADTIVFFERLFAPWLDGHPLQTNKSLWRVFPTVRNAAWSHQNVCLLGDAQHTAHFSIGSGTKLAMESAMSLADALLAQGDEPIPTRLRAWETARRPQVERLQAAAQVSLEWFENSARYLQLDADTFQFSLMTRSKRITWDELQKRDPEGMAALRGRWGGRPSLQPFTSRGVTFPNRIVVSPMCQYSADEGVPTDWHLVHLGSRAVGGAGLVMAEATAVTPEGRITPGCTGIWTDAQAGAWARIVHFVHTHSPAKIGLQIGHAGRKAACAAPWDGGRPLPAEAAWPIVGASPFPWDADSQVPHALVPAELDALQTAFCAAARRAAMAGFDVLELHMAHGYLLDSWLSPLCNHRDDEHGGSLENRLRFPLRVIAAVRVVWPAERPLFVRLNGSAWAPGDHTDDEHVAIARAMQAAGADVLDLSSGGTVPDAKITTGRMYQVPFSERARLEAGVPTMTVGAITSLDQADTIVAAGRADLVALAREHLRDPYFTRRQASAVGGAVPWPRQYAFGRR